jgi:hypothetical protein
MWLVKGAPNLMQRLSRLPPAPNVTLLDRRKPKSLSWPHANTTFTQQTYIRWCCIDLSNAPPKPDISNNVGPVKQFLSRLLQSLKRVFSSACWVVFLVDLDDFGSFVI